MMASTTSAYDAYDDYDFPPKRVTTYGKSSRPRLPAASGKAFRNGDSSKQPPVASVVKSPSPPPEQQPPPSRSVTYGRTRPQIRASKAPKAKDAAEVQSQPLPESLATGHLNDDDARTKRRKITRTYSEKREKSVGPYSTPESSPSGTRSPIYDIEKEILRSGPKEELLPILKNTPEKDVSMKDAGLQQVPFSTKTSRAFANLSVNSNHNEKKKHEFPIRLSRPQKASSSQVPTKKKSAPLEADPEGKHTLAQAPRRKRLIDALAAQADGSSSSSEELQSPPRSNAAMHSPLFQGSNSPPPAPPSEARTIVRPVMAAKKSGPKFTYSQQRTMLAEEDHLLGAGGALGGIDEESSGGSLFSFGRLTKSLAINQFSFLDEEDETVNSGAVRTIHELRQAGANSRFADEMDDILDRIGSPSPKPSSLRRGALLELAQKMKEKDFRRQFRNHSGDTGLFKSLGEETDLVSGYCILAILVTLLASSVSTHLVQQVRAQGLAGLLDRLLGETADIALLAKDKKQNLSRNGQNTLGTIKPAILALPVWEPLSPPSLSPRTLSLKCLDLVLRQSTHPACEAEIFTSAVTDQLFSVLSVGASSLECWDFPGHERSSDFYLALYVLEGHSIHAMQSRLGSRWTSRYTPIIADILEIALSRPADKFDDLESLTLRITLNVTNNNAEGSAMFVNKGLLRALASSACGAFEVVLNSMKVDAFLSKVHESLIMMLGVMINFCVYYPPASRSLEESGDASDSALNRLIRVFADNHSKTSDADSMEKTQLNVALGYLSIFLGYLCLCESIRDRFALVHPKKSLQPLLDSINEFIAFHHQVAETGSDGESKQDADFGALVRLQSLVDQLDVRR
ncbi:wings apart-like protein regulation of heterochromatin-domain-containing protein [Podospora didyma]|uniref:Wings apart-like protein regulation of heterochromatin-domain-containing protein n=1 Tax=Podospora didyma TaxID=330526 RepID=A0AAE0ND13_9PEZI|nr:wings apart-like protein regulation of heterochromatin-domain-containing protein [Podospora didyma]